MGDPNGPTDLHVDGIPSVDTASVLVPEPLTAETVITRRAGHGPIGAGVAAVTNSDMFKSPSNKNKPLAKRWDHVISEESAYRSGSSLKGLAKHLKQPGLISLGGGLPSPEYFPFERLSMIVPQPPNFSEKETKFSGKEYHIGKHDVAEGKSIYDLHIALNYGQATGSAQVLRFVTGGSGP